MISMTIYAQTPFLDLFNQATSFKITPEVVNLNTYTNLTIYFKNNVNFNNTNITISNAIIIYKKFIENIAIYGIYPTGDQVVVNVNGTSKSLRVENVCNILYNSLNFTNKIYINITSNCLNLKEYINNTQWIIGEPYSPPYSGLYNIIITNNTYYINFTYIVSPSINTNKTSYGQWLNITLDPPLRGLGLAVIGPLQIPVTSTVTIPPFALPAGDYRLVLEQNGLVLLNSSISILKAIPRIAININNTIIYGLTSYLNIKTFIFNNEYNLNISVYINGSLVATGTTPFQLKLPALDAGTYNLTVVAAETANTTRSNSSVLFKILPAPVKVEVYVNGSIAKQVVVASYGQILVLKALLNSTVAPVGVVKYFVDNNAFGDVVDTLKLGAGVHALRVVFVPSNNNFLPASANVTIVVSKSMPVLIAPRSITATYGETPNMTVGLFVYGRPIPATLVISVGNYTAQIGVNGLTTLQLPKLPAGTYEISIVFPGTQDLYPVSATSLLVVRSAKVSLIVEAPTRAVYGSSVPISVAAQPQVPGIISIYINGTLIYSAQGARVQTYWSPPRSGLFNVTASFQSLSSNYSNSVYSFYVIVERAKCSISLSLNSTEVYVLRRYLLVANSTVIPEVYVDGKYVGTSTSIPITFNSTGAHIITALFKGDDRYTPCNSALSVEVLKNPSTVTLSIPYKQALPNNPFIIYIDINTKSPIVNGYIYIYFININGKNNYTFIKYVNESKEALSISLGAPGSYEVKAYYGGNQYVEGNYSNVVAVAVVGSVLGIPAIMAASYGIAAASAYAVVVALKLKRRKFSSS